MHSVTNLVPAPGVLFAFDERACAVVHTVEDSWHYLTEGRAWAWQSIHVIGTLNSLDNQEVEYAAEFMDYGLIINDPSTINKPVSVMGTHDCGAEGVDEVRSIPRRGLRKTVSRSWSETLKLERSSLSSTLRTLQYAHEEGLPFASIEAVEDIQEAVLRYPPWWMPVRYRTPRSVAITTAVVAHHLGVRADLSFGMSHQTQDASFWCSTPGGHVGKASETLTIGRV